jgi:anaerobic selenocysteine-containing dehydrogenase
MTKMSRRDFIRLAGAGAAAAGAAGGLGYVGLQRLPGHHAPKIGTLRESQWVPTVCRVCPGGCGLLARVVDNRVVKTEGNPAHPMNQGKPCPRAQAATQVLYDPDRIRGPLRRVGERGEGLWEPISWVVAVEELSDRLGHLRDRGQAHTLLFLHDAPPSHMRQLIERFCQAYGSPNAISVDGWDVERLTHLLTQGWFDLAAHNWEETSYVLFFGGSFLEDWQPQVHMLRAYSYMRRGRPTHRSRIIQVGPRLSVSAAKADEWIPLVPGREGALALGMAHVIIRERLYDPDFVADHTDGFEEFSQLVLEEYAPEAVMGLTGIPASTIARLAREFAGLGPAVAVAGRGLAAGTNALLSHVAIHALNALVGSIDVPGGILRPKPVPFTPWEPVLTAIPSQPRLDGAALSERIIDGGPYLPQALLFHETNPLYEGVGTDLWRGAFQVIPFIVSFSSFMDESTLHADLVLPNHTFMERWVDGMPPGGLGRPTVGIGRPVVGPLHNTRHTGDVLLELARVMGGEVAQSLPWTNFESLLRFRMQGLLEAGGSISADSFDEFWGKLLERGVWFGSRYAFGEWEDTLATPSGRFQFRLDGLEEAIQRVGLTVEGLVGNGGESRLPRYEPPVYAGDGEEYPLHLVPYRVIADAGCRAPNAPLLWEMYGLHIKEMWQSWAELHPGTAEHLGIQDGDEVWVESPQGRIRLKARIYEGAMLDAVNIPLGGGHTAGGRWASQVDGGNVAELIVPQTDPYAGSIAWGGTRVKVYKE